MGNDLEKMLKEKEGTYSEVRQKISKLDEQSRQVAAQIQKEKDTLLTKGLELQGAIKLLRNELGINTEEDRKAAAEAKTQNAEVVDAKGPVNLEQK